MVRTPESAAQYVKYFVRCQFGGGAHGFEVKSLIKQIQNLVLLNDAQFG
jgi:hypothetical protein